MKSDKLLESTLQALEESMNLYYVILSTNRGMWGGMQSYLKSYNKVVAFTNKADAQKLYDKIQSEQSSVNNFNSYSVVALESEPSDAVVFNTYNEYEDYVNENKKEKEEKEKSEEAEKVVLLQKVTDSVSEEFKDNENVKLRQSIPTVSLFDVTYITKGEERTYGSINVSVIERNDKYKYEIDGMTFNTDTELERAIEVCIKRINKLLDKVKNKNENKKVEESKMEDIKTLHDLLEARNGEGIDIYDATYDMIVYFECELTDNGDAYDKVLSLIASKTNLIDGVNEDEIHTMDGAGVDIAKFVEENFEAFDSLFEVNAEDKEEEIELIVTDVIPGVVSGELSEAGYEELFKLLTK